MDGLIFSTTLQQRTGQGLDFSTPRFTAFFHIGSNINYDFSDNVGLFTGFNIKNIGFIEKYQLPDSTVKRRVYTFGVPLGIKFGDLRYGSYVYAGGGIDFPFHFKEKGFITRSHKTKTQEWFSSRTPAAMPYVFIGAFLRPVMSIKLQYYPANFLNPDYKERIYTEDGPKISRPYEDYDVKLIMLTLGFNIKYRP